MDYENSTGLELAESGEQESVVGSQDESLKDGGRGDVVDPREEEDGNEKGFDVGEDGDEESDSGSAGRREAKKQTRRENAAIRAARLRAEAEARERARAEADEEIAEMGITDPYTGKTFRSMQELREYGGKLKAARIARQAQQTGKSTEEVSEDEENRAFISRMRREQKRREEADAEQKRRRDFAQRDLADFMEKYEDVDVEKLISNRKFTRFCGSRMGKEPLSSLYEDFCALVSDTEAAAEARAESRSARSTGAGSTGGAVLSPSQKRALDEWNAEHPEMAMTAKEFLNR